MKQVRWLVAAVVAAASASTPLAAQEPATVTGRVTSAAGTAEAAVSVRIASLSVGTTTSADGTYRLVIPAARLGSAPVTITASRVGLTPVSRSITLTPGATLTQNFQLGAAALGIEGIVVTALGVERQRSQLGTAQQQLRTDDLNNTRAPSVVNQMQGKVAGVQITGGGTQGGSNNIVIRGSNSIAGNNQPLFVVDGIPVSNRNRGGGIGSGYDYGNAIADVNPEDIATVTVLKGPNAAAIYGSRAANGAIVITTKSGAAAGGRIRTEFSTTLTTERPSILPDFQDRYGQGAGGKYFQTADQSWGPQLDAGLMVCQHDSPRDAAGSCTPTPWVSHPNNVRDFFERGVTSQSTLAFSGGTDRANARLSFGYDNTDGYVPENSFQKYTAVLNGALSVNDRLKVSGNLQYIRNEAKNRPGTGYNQSILEQFFWFGRQVDINSLRDYNRTGGLGQPGNREFNWNYNYHNNPFWIQSENQVTDRRDRVIGQGSVAYEVADGITATLRSGSDLYAFNADQNYAPRYLGFVNPSLNGGYTFIDDFSNESNTELLVTADREVSSKVSINALAGGGLRREYYRANTQSTNGLTVAGVYSPTNAAVAPTLSQFINRRHVNSVFGSLAATYDDWFTLEGTARNDWSSTLPSGQNSYFYPSLSASAVLSDAVPALRDNPVLSYFKVRGSIAEVGNDADPYRLLNYFNGVAQQFNGQPQYTQGDVLANTELKPELTRSTEFGTEMEFFGGRLSFDASIYDKRTRNQIFSVPVSGASGFLSQSINAGLVTNKGFEALVGVTPIDRDGLRWTSTFNYGRNRSQVEDLFPGTESVVLGSGLFGEAQLEARVGKPLGAIYGAKFARDEEGNLLTSGGLPFTTGEMEYLGSIEPSWTGGWNNELNFRGLQLGVLFDVRRGGNIMSYTNLVGSYSGVLENSLQGREVDVENPGILVNGIDVETNQANTERVTSEHYFQGIFGAAEPYVYDASYVKLRELRFGFDLPGRYAQRVGARSINVAITGRNLYTWAKIPNIDPEFAYSSGNFQGFEYGILSNPRSIGISFRVRP